MKITCPHVLAKTVKPFAIFIFGQRLNSAYLRCADRYERSLKQLSLTSPVHFTTSQDLPQDNSIISPVVELSVYGIFL